MSTDVTKRLTDSLWEPEYQGVKARLGMFVEYHQVNLPYNDRGICTKVINPTVFAEVLAYADTDMTPDDLPEEDLTRAIWDVDFDDGLPCIEGVPIWERLDGEPIQLYKLFKEYREMKYISGSRAIAKLSASTGVPGRQLSVLSKIYNWPARTKAFDVFNEDQKALKKQYEQDSFVSKQADYASKMLDQAFNYLDKHPEQLNPKTAIQMVEMAIKFGRVAVGLHADKPGTPEQTVKANKTTTQINVQAIANSDGTTSNASISNENLSPVQKQVLANSEDVSHLQSILGVLDRSGALKVTQDEAANKAAKELVEANSTPAEDGSIDVAYEDL